MDDLKNPDPIQGVVPQPGDITYETTESIPPKLRFSGLDSYKDGMLSRTRALLEQRFLRFSPPCPKCGEVFNAFIAEPGGPVSTSWQVVVSDKTCQKEAMFMVSGLALNFTGSDMLWEALQRAALTLLDDRVMAVATVRETATPGCVVAKREIEV